MSKVYTESEIKDLVLDQINQIRKLSDLNITFTDEDANQAYDTAVRECGFTVPVAGDVDLENKNTWLINRQRRWYYDRLREKLILLVENNDIRGGGIIDRLSKIIGEIDADFQKAKVSAETAHLFLDASILATGDVINSGFVQDRMGQDKTKYAS